MAALVPGSLNPLGIHYIATAGSLTFIATIVVAMRFWARINQARKYHSQKLAVDDWLIVVGLFFLYAMTFTSVTFVMVGAVGWPGVDLSNKQKSRFYIVFFTYQLLYALASPIIKLSVILYYKRLFPMPTFAKVSYVIAALCIAWGISVVFVTIFQCSPIRGNVIYSARVTGHCINYYDFFQGQSISNCLLDAIIVCMPMPIVWRLRLDLDRKIFVTVIFLLGGFVVVASILRVVYFAQVSSTDPERTLILAALWTMVEPSVGVISACLPALRPLYSLFFHRMMSIQETVRSSISSRSGSVATYLDRRGSDRKGSAEKDNQDTPRKRSLLYGLISRTSRRDREGKLQADVERPSISSTGPHSIGRWMSQHHKNHAEPRDELNLNGRHLYGDPAYLDENIFRNHSCDSAESHETGYSNTSSDSSVDPAQSVTSVV